MELQFITARKIHLGHKWITYFLGTDWNMMVVDLVFGLFWIAIIFGFVTQLLLLYGIQKLNEAFMLPHLILKMSGLFVSIFHR